MNVVDIVNIVNIVNIVDSVDIEYMGDIVDLENIVNIVNIVNSVIVGRLSVGPPRCMQIGLLHRLVNRKQGVSGPADPRIGHPNAWISGPYTDQ